MTRVQRTVGIPIAALAIYVLAACQDSTSPGNTTPPITGTYTLSTINGLALPAEISHTGGYQVLARQLTLTFDSGAVTEHGTFETHTNGTVTTETVSDSGSYVQSHDTVTMTMVSGTQRTMVVDGTLLMGTHPLYFELYWRVTP